MQSRSRTGFTLIELMVSMALTLFVMVILSQAFVMSLETFAGMKGIGDMQQNLRTAETILRNDLGQDHFEGIRRLSDPGITSTASPIQAGFFAVMQRSAPVNNPAAVFTQPPGMPPVNAYVSEGVDSNGIFSARAADHVLYMTCKRRGNRQENFYTTTPALGSQTAYGVSAADYNNVTLTTAGLYSSQWAEVVYYLKRVGSTEEPNNPKSTLGTPTFGLYRAQFVMAPTAANLSTANSNLSTYAGMSCNLGPVNVAFYSPADAAGLNLPPPLPTSPALPVKRVISSLAAFDPLSMPPNPNPFADPSINARLALVETLVLPNVLSFQVQLMPVGDPDFIDFNPPFPVPTQLYTTPIPPYQLTPSVTQAMVYDTALFGFAGYKNNVGLKGIQITLRVWDNKTRQTRQVTVVQDL